ncbi:protein ALTERED XYLOGLUCAN 9-like [Rutidosis leptorrhynchoides]|uniref:protein ALTERED XYLOGLUCAN 9-like n=1 Tax=Rutidosis leptorrhynchoides TaxID=125765 RepID=UPI003A98EF30
MFFGAVQLGLMAACVVLFVPMGMAGWHLSRNKVLFFSGALFISLAVCIHLIPYFPSFFPQTPSVISINQDLTTTNSCISTVNDVTFYSNFDGFSWNWDNSSRSSGLNDCDFQKLGRVDVLDLLNGSWVVVTGDSQARLFVVSLLDLVLGSDEMEKIHEDLFKRHSDHHIVVIEIGLKLDFIWSPYVTNLTDLVIEFKRNNTYPDVLVMGSGLWHMLHFTNYSNYGSSLRVLRDSLVQLLPVSNSDDDDVGQDPARVMHMFWLGMPTLINRLLNTEEKQVKMTREMCNAYDQELYKSKLLKQNGGSFFLLDVEMLSNRCGVECSLDGMHYNDVVYEATVHVMLNALLIESHQKL